MKKLKVEGGGFPGTSLTWRHVRDMVEQVAQLGTAISGNGIIASGMNPVGGNQISSGLLVLNGELYPFSGGEKKDYLKIVEDVDSVQYLRDENDDGEGDQIEAYFDRYVEFTSISSESDVTYDDLIRIKTIAELSKRIPPIKTAFPYFGIINDIPKGWQLCDGTNGTPDMSGKFVAGYDPDDADHQMGSSGGQKKVTLTESQMPQHKHSGNTDYGGSHNHTYQKAIVGRGYDTKSDDNPLGSNESASTSNGGGHSHSLNTNFAGGSESHENRPPYFTMAWIAYTGI